MARTGKGWRVDDCRGRRVGTLEHVYPSVSGAPAWFLVRLSRWSTRFVLTPAAEVLRWQGRVSLPWERTRIERAPLLYAPPGEVTRDMADRLRRHYQLAELSDVHLTVRRTVA